MNCFGVCIQMCLRSTIAAIVLLSYVGFAESSAHASGVGIHDFTESNSNPMTETSSNTATSTSESKNTATEKNEGEKPAEKSESEKAADAQKAFIKDSLGQEGVDKLNEINSLLDQMKGFDKDSEMYKMLRSNLEKSIGDFEKMFTATGKKANELNDLLKGPQGDERRAQLERLGLNLANAKNALEILNDGKPNSPQDLLNGIKNASIVSNAINTAINTAIDSFSKFFAGTPKTETQTNSETDRNTDNETRRHDRDKTGDRPPHRHGGQGTGTGDGTGTASHTAADQTDKPEENKSFWSRISDGASNLIKQAKDGASSIINSIFGTDENPQTHARNGEGTGGTTGNESIDELPYDRRPGFIGPPQYDPRFDGPRTNVADNNTGTATNTGTGSNWSWSDWFTNPVGANNNTGTATNTNTGSSWTDWFTNPVGTAAKSIGSAAGALAADPSKAISDAVSQTIKAANDAANWIAQNTPTTPATGSVSPGEAKVGPPSGFSPGEVKGPGSSSGSTIVDSSPPPPSSSGGGTTSVATSTSPSSSSTGGSSTPSSSSSGVSSGTGSGGIASSIGSSGSGSSSSGSSSVGSSGSGSGISSGTGGIGVTTHGSGGTEAGAGIGSGGEGTGSGGYAGTLQSGNGNGSSSFGGNVNGVRPRSGTVGAQISGFNNGEANNGTNTTVDDNGNGSNVASSGTSLGSTGTSSAVSSVFPDNRQPVDRFAPNTNKPSYSTASFLSPTSALSNSGDFFGTGASSNVTSTTSSNSNGLSLGVGNLLSASDNPDSPKTGTGTRGQPTTMVATGGRTYTNRAVGAFDSNQPSSSGATLAGGNTGSGFFNPAGTAVNVNPNPGPSIQTVTVNESSSGSSFNGSGENRVVTTSNSGTIDTRPTSSRSNVGEKTYLASFTTSGGNDTENGSEIAFGNNGGKVSSLVRDISSLGKAFVARITGGPSDNDVRGVTNGNDGTEAKTTLIQDIKRKAYGVTEDLLVRLGFIQGRANEPVRAFKSPAKPSASVRVGQSDLAKMTNTPQKAKN